MFIGIFISFAILGQVLSATSVPSFNISVYTLSTTALITCTEIESNNPVYVRGTYWGTDLSGYFEGPATAYGSWIKTYVNGYEVAALNSDGKAGMIKPRSISAEISMDGNTFTGHRWENGAGSNISDTTVTTFEFSRCRNSFKSCLSLSKEYSMLELARMYCLWVPNTSPVGLNSNNVYTESATAISSKGKPSFPSYFYPTGLGASSTKGVVLGSYGYMYPATDCAGKKGCNPFETGYFGSDSITAYGRSATIMATTWKSISGPYTGQYGSSIYTFADSTLTALTCTVTTNSDKSVTLGGCYIELYYLYPQTTKAEQTQVKSWINSLVSFIPSKPLNTVQQLINAIKASMGK